MRGVRRVAGTLAVAVVLAAAPLAAQTPAFGPDHGRFRILLRGKAVGTEDFTISRQGNQWSALSRIQLHLAGQPDEKDTADLTLAADGSPVHYHWAGEASHVRSIDVAFHDHAAEMTLRQPDSAPAIEAFSFPFGHMVVLDNNVYADYAILARLYDWKSGGPQKFSVLIPQDQAPGTVTVESFGKRPVAGKPLVLLTVRSPDLEVDLYLDGARRLVLLRVPGSGAEVTRE